MFFLLVVALMAALPRSASAIQPVRSGQEAFLSRAVFADGRLWLLTDAGVLSYLTNRRDRRVEELLPEPAFDLCLQDGHPIVITGSRDGGTEWTLRRRIHAGWGITATLHVESDAFVSLYCSSQRISVLTTARLIEVENDKQTAVALSGRFLPGRVSSLFGTADGLLVGINAGEWGGGLQYIDRRNGRMATIDDGPITDIASVPWRSDCVAVAVGLVHFLPDGRIDEVCGNNVKQLYSQVYKGRTANGPVEPIGTVAFFGVINQSDALLAAGIDGLYRIGQDGTARVIPLPKFQEIDGMRVSFDIPNAIVVLTDVNQRLSVSGSVPILGPY